MCLWEQVLHRCVSSMAAAYESGVARTAAGSEAARAMGGRQNAKLSAIIKERDLLLPEGLGEWCTQCLVQSQWCWLGRGGGMLWWCAGKGDGCSQGRRERKRQRLVKSAGCLRTQEGLASYRVAGQGA